MPRVFSIEERTLEGYLPGELHFGIDGATFTPNVSEDGTLSWENNRNLPNPAPVNLRGYTPQKGKDYFDGNDYVLTDADKKDIAEQVAEMVDVTGGAGVVVQDTPPEDTDVLWIDPTDDNDDGFQDAVNTALAKAKASGEFNGEPGQPGYTPVKGTDYYTEADKAEMVNAVISGLPTWTGGSY